jgi:hypothetical protein
MEKDSGIVFSLFSSMTNLGSIGSLVAFLILGEQGFALVPFYKLFEEAWVYGRCFPIAAGAKKLDDGRHPAPAVDSAALRKRCPLNRYLGTAFLIRTDSILIGGSIGR